MVILIMSTRKVLSTQLLLTFADRAPCGSDAGELSRRSSESSETFSALTA